MQPEEAEEAARKWFEHYPKAKAFHDAVKDRMSKRYEIKDKRMRGLHADRYQKLPMRGELLEFQFANAWAKQHGEGYGPGTLAHLLGDGQTPAQPTDRDYLVAATVIQWLGSSVGQSFIGEALSLAPKGRSS